MLKGYVYILFSKKDLKSYTGSTVNIEKRIKEHNSGENKSTKHGRPWKLLHLEEFKNLKEARIREKFLKTRSGRRELNKIFENIG